MELRTWRWLYAHPEATAADLRETVLRISDEVWGEFFAEHFGPDPYHILGAYQHMVAHPLYLPDYAIGQMISHQIRAHVRTRDVAAETKRICSIGRLTPAAWMKAAVGGSLSAAPLIEDSRKAVKALRDDQLLRSYTITCGRQVAGLTGVGAKTVEAIDRCLSAAQGAPRPLGAS